MNQNKYPKTLQIVAKPQSKGEERRWEVWDEKSC